MLTWKEFYAFLDSLDWSEPQHHCQCDACLTERTALYIEREEEPTDDYPWNTCPF